MPQNRRDWILKSTALAGAAAAGNAVAQTTETATPPDGKVWRIGVISARRQGQPQKINGHTWHFAQYLHPTIDLPTAQMHLDPGNKKYFEEIVRNPACDFGILPFSDTRISHYYEEDPKISQLFADSFPGVEVATSIEQMVEEVDAVWLGDASGTGDDHFDLIAPALEKGLPTFCDKPIGQTVEGTRKILELAKKHKAPIMSGSIFSYEWGVEETRRLVAKGELGEVQHVAASLMGGYSPESWFVYGQHPCWSLVTLLGGGVESVSLHAQGSSAHGLVVYPEAPSAEIWYGRPDLRTGNQYNETAVHFTKGLYRFTPAIEGNFWFGHHYEMFNMARAFREMIRTGVEPAPHEEIMAVTAMIYAGAKSLKEKSRLVELAEVLA
ncbi:MAG: putative dehydrogenase [Verrucomicrobiales bacterium]|jgi:predicted dehydrogenase